MEVAHELRRGGTSVDIEGETIATLTRMGLIDAVRARALPPRAFALKDADNVTLGAMGAGSPSDDDAGERHEIHRDDLLDILFQAVEGAVTFMFGRSIRQIVNSQDGVSVTFDDGSECTYALVFGCDGNRSNTRKLLFGSDAQFSFFMGGYFFLKVVPETGLLSANTSEVFNVPGRMAMLNGYDDRTDIGLGFRAEHEIDYDYDYDYRNRGEQRRLIHKRCDGLGWKVPDMLKHVDADDDFYFDRITQIRMPTGRRDVSL